MLKTDFIHSRSALVSIDKKDLISHIMLLEHNYNTMQIRLDQQAENFLTLCKNCPNKSPVNMDDDIRFIKNYLSRMPMTYRQRNQNWCVVRDLLMNGTSTSGMTSCIEKCRNLAIDPYGHSV